MAKRGDIHINDDELRKLSLDISGAPRRIQFQSSRVLDKKVGPLVADAMRADATGHVGNYFGKPGTEYVIPLEQHVSHEMVTRDRLEVGIEAKGAGSLAHIIVLGSPRNAPAYDHMAGPRRVLPIVDRIFAGVAEDAMLGDEE